VQRGFLTHVHCSALARACNVNGHTRFRQVHREVFDFVKKNINVLTNLDKAVINTAALPQAKNFMRKLETDVIFNGRGLLLLPKIDGLETVHEMKLGTFVMTSLVGEPLVQNAEGNKAILVYDRDYSRRMQDGQRYHQSHEGEWGWG
jgi:hypothetical protein